MDKRIILLIFLFAFQFANAQEVRFKNGQLDNTLVYPIVSLVGNPEAEKTLNQHILDIVSEYNTQEYCIGQYGYVQKTNFIQLNFYFNCIDLDESVTAYYLFNLSNGELCPPSEMLLDKEKKRFTKLLHERIASHLTDVGTEEPSKELIEAIEIDDCAVKLAEEGMEITIDSYESWPKEALIISWNDLRPFLKSTFL